MRCKPTLSDYGNSLPFSARIVKTFLKSLRIVEFRKRLAKALALKGWTPNRLATELGTSASRVTSWLDGESMPGGEHLVRMPATLEINGHWLLTGNGHINATPGDAEAFMGEVEALLDRYAIPQATEQERATGRQGTRLLRPAKADEAASKEPEDRSTPDRERRPRKPPKHGRGGRAAGGP